MSPEKQYISRRKLRSRFGEISEMTIWRWERDEKLGFPKALTINGRRYYDIAEIEGWEHKRAAQAPVNCA